MRGLVDDLWRSVRTLRRTPGFTLLAVTMLGLGLGANAAMFSVVDAVWLRPLPYAAPDRLVTIEEGVPRLASISPRLPVNAYDFLEWRKGNRTLESLALVSAGGATLSVGGGAAQAVALGQVSANFFDLLAIRPAAGRFFADGEDQPGAGHVIVLTDGLWARLFNRDPSAIGRRVRVSGELDEIIGVVPAGVHLPRQGQIQTIAFGDVDADLWRPLQLHESDFVQMAEFDYGCLARLKPGVTPAVARADLEVIEQRIAHAAGAGADLHALVTPLASQAGSRAEDAVLMLSVAVGTVLLIVGVNLSNALLSRATGRRRDLAIQAALGAGRGRLIRQALVESLLMGLAGSVIGVLVAAWAVHTVLAAAPLNLPQWHTITVDARVTGFVCGLALALAALMGALPAWKSADADPQEALRSADRASTEGRRGQTVRRTLIGIEVALSTACLVLAGLLVGSFVRLVTVDKGFRTDHGFVIPLSLAGARVPTDEAAVTVARGLLSQVASLPGVTAVGVTNRLPLSGEGSNLSLFSDSAQIASDLHPVADYRTVSAGFFAAMGVPLEAGRLMRDGDGDHLVGLLSEGTAARLWPGENPIGHHFRLGGAEASPIEIIGIVGDVRGVSLQKAPNLTVYLPFWQRLRGLALVVRTAADPQPVMPVVAAAVRAALPDQPAARVRLFDDLVDATLVSRRFQLDVVMAFAGVALLLAAMGVYTVVAQSMARRTREVGIRLALGAARADVWRLAGQEGLVPVAGGLVVGVGLAFEATGLIRSMLFGLGGFDPMTYLTVAAVMVLAAAAACAWPALRASRIDPLVALREF
jgi:predicted permease